MIKYIYYVVVFLIYVFFTSLLSSSEVEVSVDSFIGPRICEKYIYKMSDNTSIVVKAVSQKKEGGIVMEEAIKVPGLELPDGAESIVSKYTLFIQDGKLAKVSMMGERILLQEPLISNSKKWNNTFLFRSNGKTTQGVSLCNIVNTYNKDIFSKDRLVIKVKCESSAENIETITEEEYVEYIGMFSRIETTKTKNGSQYGKKELILDKVINSCE